MENILTQIINKKKVEIEHLKKNKLTAESVSNGPSLVEKLRKASRLEIISEIKRASPSKGNINLDVNPVQQAMEYERNGAAAISVLTDESFFKGTFKDLHDVSEAVSIPRLCKDFIINEVQIDYARHHGATVILLIVAALPANRLEQLYRYAKSLGLDVLTEVHDEFELETALTLEAELIGINNRDLKTFEVHLSVTERLAKNIDLSRHILVSESGIKTREDAIRVKEAGAKAILVGETLMRANNVSQMVKALQVT
ncbi:indole-3-glycerol phosphate synthase TrpC [Bacillus massiliglaciei]|uniref:indole-3-glycerol phosphate synthase TrpC n=1 Tax=Bacillus massiliglaciei TaxID=1816693 RepID=UPI000AF9FD99|nr:indole-3-glycerol phosphate synthase TrpC [Bacillus massiliglaciei]